MTPYTGARILRRPQSLALPPVSPPQEDTWGGTENRVTPAIPTLWWPRLQGHFPGPVLGDGPYWGSSVFPINMWLLTCAGFE